MSLGCSARGGDSEEPPLESQEHPAVAPGRDLLHPPAMQAARRRQDREAPLPETVHAARRAQPDRAVGGRVAFDVHEGALASVRQDAPTFTRELRIAAAVKWYELRRINQGRAAEIAGVSRAEFIDALSRYGVSPFQQTADEIVQDALEAGHE